MLKVRLEYCNKKEAMVAKILAICRIGWFAILGGKERLLMHFRSTRDKKAHGFLFLCSSFSSRASRVAGACVSPTSCFLFLCSSFLSRASRNSKLLIIKRSIFVF